MAAVERLSFVRLNVPHRGFDDATSQRVPPPHITISSVHLSYYGVFSSRTLNLPCPLPFPAIASPLSHSLTPPPPTTPPRRCLPRFRLHDTDLVAVSAGAEENQWAKPDRPRAPQLRHRICRTLPQRRALSRGEVSPGGDGRGSQRKRQARGAPEIQGELCTFELWRP